MRQLKYHERKLLKKVNLLAWKGEHAGREAQVMRRYHLQGREDYGRYSRLCGLVTKLVQMLQKLDPADAARVEMAEALTRRLHVLGVLPTDRQFLKCEKLAVSAFCRRRLAVVLTKIKMAENMREAVTFVEQGHVRVGPRVVTDPAYHVTRNLEDFVTWVDASKIKRKVMRYNDRLDDFDLETA